LAYALGLPIAGTACPAVRQAGLNIVKPIYNQEPNISVKKKNIDL
jgi:hypothetical protein